MTLSRGRLGQLSRIRALGWGAFVLLALHALAVLAPWLALYPPDEQHRSAPDAPPMALHLASPAVWWSEGPLYVHPRRLVDVARRTYRSDPTTRVYLRPFHRGLLLAPTDATAGVFLLGTDSLGRDLLSRLLWGARVSLAVGLVGVVVSLTIGTLVGTVAGYVGGWTDDLLMRLCEVMMALPSFFFLLALAAVIPAGISPGLTFLLLVGLMSLLRWAGVARLVRGLVRSVRELEYVEAARALGGTSPRVIRRHVVPAIRSTLVVTATLAIPGFILGESALSLLGVGIQEPGTSWGLLLADAQNLKALDRRPWLLAPGACIALTTLAYNVVGDRLRDLLDPRGEARS